MDKPETSFCCKERGVIYNLAHDLGLNCITEHPGYEGNCLNEYVVETSFYEFLQGYGHVGDEEPVHRYVLSPSYEMSNVMRKPVFRRFQPVPT